MCGILGLIGTRWRPAAQEALEALGSRGPDAQTVLDLGEAVFGHARLAVIDLAGGAQPMRSADGRYTLVFNGEIYNFAALRRELQCLGVALVTDHSDTEALLAGYVRWGGRVLERLDGMFAFAVWDSAERRLFAARDPLGIKPLFYSAVDGGLVFASTLEPFFRLPGFPRRLDAEALRDYLAFQTPLAPQTMLADVRSLPPGHALRFDAAAGGAHLERYWSIPRPQPRADERETILARIDAALTESVRRQLIADVPLGAFLSGGIDSSLVVRYLASQSAAPLETFSLGFGDAQFDESAHARAVAERFGCRHTVLQAPAVDAGGFHQAIATLDQPLADPAYVMTHALSRLTRKHVTVAVSGDGGDELFGGYERFLDTEDRHPRRWYQPALRALIAAGALPAALARRSLSGRELLHYRRVELGPWPGRKNLVRLLAPEVAARAHPERTLGLWLDLIDELGGHMDSATLMRADLWTYLSENCLAKVDRASMAFGLEVRVPFLGRPVLEAVLTLPAELHFAGGTKALLTGLARRYLPECVWNRPKHGFSVPLDALFRGPWREVCEEAIASAGEVAPFLDAPAVARLWREALGRRASRRLGYTLVVLLLWLKEHRFHAVT
ncbi:MAG: asparagine synthase (glutamine-hydrolyzing) [Betaproteobacteria bacterium]|nr:asparagine synthase (glutamine-hydrolyzing) [Betaproteobacteria bacterium]